MMIASENNFLLDPPLISDHHEDAITNWAAYQSQLRQLKKELALLDKQIAASRVSTADPKHQFALHNTKLAECEHLLFQINKLKRVRTQLAGLCRKNAAAATHPPKHHTNASTEEKSTTPDELPKCISEQDAEQATEKIKTDEQSFFEHVGDGLFADDSLEKLWATVRDRINCMHAHSPSTTSLEDGGNEAAFSMLRAWRMQLVNAEWLVQLGLERVQRREEQLKEIEIEIIHSIHEHDATRLLRLIAAYQDKAPHIQQLPVAILSAALSRSPHATPPSLETTEPSATNELSGRSSSDQVIPSLPNNSLASVERQIPAPNSQHNHNDTSIGHSSSAPLSSTRTVALNIEPSTVLESSEKLNRAPSCTIMADRCYLTASVAADVDIKNHVVEDLSQVSSQDAEPGTECDVASGTFFSQDLTSDCPTGPPAIDRLSSRTTEIARNPKLCVIASATGPTPLHAQEIVESQEGIVCTNAIVPGLIATESKMSDYPNGRNVSVRNGELEIVASNLPKKDPSTSAQKGLGVFSPEPQNGTVQRYQNDLNVLGLTETRKSLITAFENEFLCLKKENVFADALQSCVVSSNNMTSGYTAKERQHRWTMPLVCCRTLNGSGYPHELEVSDELENPSTYDINTTDLMERPTVAQPLPKKAVSESSNTQPEPHFDIHHENSSVSDRLMGCDQRVTHCVQHLNAAESLVRTPTFESLERDGVSKSYLGKPVNNTATEPLVTEVFREVDIPPCSRSHSNSLLSNFSVTRLPTDAVSVCSNGTRAYCSEAENVGNALNVAAAVKSKRNTRSPVSLLFDASSDNHRRTKEYHERNVSAVKVQPHKRQSSDDNRVINQQPSNSVSELSPLPGIAPTESATHLDAAPTSTTNGSRVSQTPQSSLTQQRLKESLSQSRHLDVSDSFSYGSAAANAETSWAIRNCGTKSIGNSSSTATEHRGRNQRVSASAKHPFTQAQDVGNTISLMKDSENVTLDKNPASRKDNPSECFQSLVYRTTVALPSVSPAVFVSGGEALGAPLITHEASAAGREVIYGLRNNGSFDASFSPLPRSATIVRWSRCPSPKKQINDLQSSFPNSDVPNKQQRVQSNSVPDSGSQRQSVPISRDTVSKLLVCHKEARVSALASAETVPNAGQTPKIAADVNDKNEKVITLGVGSRPSFATNYLRHPQSKKRITRPPSWLSLMLCCDDDKLNAGIKKCMRRVLDTACHPEILESLTEAVIQPGCGTKLQAACRFVRVLSRCLSGTQKMPLPSNTKSGRFGSVEITHKHGPGVAVRVKFIGCPPSHIRVSSKFSVAGKTKKQSRHNYKNVFVAQKSLGACVACSKSFIQ